MFGDFSLQLKCIMCIMCVGLFFQNMAYAYSSVDNLSGVLLLLSQNPSPHDSEASSSKQNVPK